MSRSIVDLLDPTIEGMCEVQDLLYNDFTATLFTTDVFSQHSKTFASLPLVCKMLPADKNFHPARGELVAAYSPTEWWARAIVLSQVEETYHMAFCDSAVSQKLITDVRQLPKEFSEIPRLGIRIYVRKFNIEEEDFRNNFLKRGLKFRFKVTKSINGEHRAVLLSTETKMQLCEVAVSEWHAKWEDRGLRSVPLRPGEPVRVMVHCSAATMYVRPMMERQDKKWQSLIQEVGAHCYSVKPMEHMPDKGQLVACKYVLDGCYYRALVMGFRSNEIEVCYVDFGNTEYVLVEQLKPLSQKLIETPCQVVLVRLKDVESLPMTCNVVGYLNRLVLGTTKLTVMFNESYAREGVELLKSNKPISKIINDLLKPNWKVAIAEGKNPTVDVLMDNEIPEIRVPIGRPLQLSVLSVEGPDIFFGCPFDNDISHYVMSRLHEDLAAFCQANPATCYVPRINELCIVMLPDKNWYRALCVEAQNANTSSRVLLIDFGVSRIVENVNIRKMCEDFVWIDSTALLCSVEGLSKNLSDDLTSRLKKLITPFSHHQVTITRKSEGGMYFLHMPDIVETLRKEGY